MNTLLFGSFLFSGLVPSPPGRAGYHFTYARLKISIFLMTSRFSQWPPSPFSALNVCGKGITFPRASIGPQPGTQVGGDRDMAKI